MQEPQKASQSGAKVTVACKIPAGLELRLFEMVTVRHPIMGGGFREVQESRVRTDVGSVLIHGNAIPYGKQPAHRIVMAPGAPMTDGFALTPNIDKDFFDEWLKQNKDSAIVKNGLIFAYEKPDAVTAEAKDRAKTQRSGLEPLNQGKDPRADKRIEKADQKDAA